MPVRPRLTLRLLLSVLRRPSLGLVLWAVVLLAIVVGWAFAHWWVARHSVSTPVAIAAVLGALAVLGVLEWLRRHIDL